MDKITITKTLPNGKVITIQVPADAAESIIANSQKLPYSPQGTYLFMYKDEPFKMYDVFISSFDGNKFSGTYGYPPGGNYEYTGDITGEKSVDDDMGFQRFTGYFSSGGREPIPIAFATSESDGIIKNWRFSKPDMYYTILTTEPYSPEGWYHFGEHLNEAELPYLKFTILITSFDGNNFKGKYVTKYHKSEVLVYGELEGSVGVIKDESAPIVMYLYAEKDGEVSVYKTITGNVDVQNGLYGLYPPFKIIPLRQIP